MKLDLLAGEIRIRADEIETGKKIIDFEEISLSNTSVAFQTDSQPENQSNVQNDTPGGFPWSVRGDELSFQDVSFSIAKYGAAKENNPLPGFSVLNLAMNISDIQIDSTDINAEIERLKFDLGNSLSLSEMSGNVSSNSKRTKIVVKARTANSKLNLDGSGRRKYL